MGVTGWVLVESCRGNNSIINYHTCKKITAYLKEKKIVFLPADGVERIVYRKNEIETLGIVVDFIKWGFEGKVVVVK